MLCGLTAYAQSDFGEEEAGVGVPKAKKFAFFIGPKVGATFTTMTDPKQGALYDSFGIGYSGGVAVQGRFGNSSPQSPGGTGIFGAGLELKYKLNSVKTLGVDEKEKKAPNSIFPILKCLSTFIYIRHTSRKRSTVSI